MEQEKKRKENLKKKLKQKTGNSPGVRLTDAAFRLTGLACHHFALFLLLLSAGQEKVGGGEMTVGVVWNRLLAQGHAADGCHVSLRAEHVERNSECASDLAHTAQTFLVVGTGTTDVN